MTPSPARRRYSSPLREAEAARTRTRIVEAAGELFVRDGYAATPMRAIAERAGVSIQSVHLAGPKAALLIAAFERSFAGDEGRHSLLERPELQSIVAEPDAEVALGRYVEFLVDANQRAAGIIHAMRAAADADAQVREAYEDLEQRRRRDMLLGADLLVTRGLVDAGRRQEVADVFGYLTWPESYQYFVEESGWSLEAYTAWLGDAIRTLLFGSG